MTDEEKAMLIIDTIRNNPWSFSIGQRNDDCVDFILACLIMGYTKEHIWELICETIDNGVLKRENGTLPVMTTAKWDKYYTDNHFQRIYPYAMNWVQYDNWSDYLLGHYDWEK